LRWTRDRACCWIIAGPKGAGKTTFALRFLPDVVNCHRFVNADLIAAGSSPLATTVDSCACYMNDGQAPELVFEQRGNARRIFHSEYHQHLIEEIGR
jgi:hypothetical protein